MLFWWWNYFSWACCWILTNLKAFHDISFNDQTRQIYDANISFRLMVLSTKKSHFDPFNNIMLVFMWNKLNAVGFWLHRSWKKKRMKQIPSSIKHITKRNHLRIKTKLFRLNRILPKMPFCSYFNALLQQMQHIESLRGCSHTKWILIPICFYNYNLFLWKVFDKNCEPNNQWLHESIHPSLICYVFDEQTLIAFLLMI